MVSISLKDEEMNQILSKAILESLSEDAKNTIIGDAVKHLNEKVGGVSWNDPDRDKTVLQVAFQYAVDVLVNQIVLELLRDTMYDTVKDQVKDLLQQFPSVTMDPALQVKVAGTIMDHMRERESRY